MTTASSGRTASETTPALSKYDRRSAYFAGAVTGSDVDTRETEGLGSATSNGRKADVTSPDEGGAFDGRYDWLRPIWTGHWATGGG